MDYPPKMVVTGNSYDTRGGLHIRCPSCLHKVSLLTASNLDVPLLDASAEDRPYDELVAYAAMRICPNRDCRQFLFVMYDDDGVIGTWPPERIDFDATNIPERVLTALEEAISCHAVGCYVAAGMMVRKTLEELCKDQGVKGPTLQKRIQAFVNSGVVMPKELLDGLDDLRLLGNDAAHVEAKTYEQIGQEEVEVSIEFTKEVLKAVYQYSDLLERLRDLKKSRTGDDHSQT